MLAVGFHFRVVCPRVTALCSRGCRSFVFLVKHVVVAWVVNLKTNPWCGFPTLGSAVAGLLDLWVRISLCIRQWVRLCRTFNFDSGNVDFTSIVMDELVRRSR